MIQLTGHGLMLRDVWEIAHRRGSGEFSDYAHANVLTRAFFGVRPEVVEPFITVLNGGLLSEIPNKGFVGTSGNLV